MAYGIVNETRKLAGGYSTTTVSDAEIIEFIKYSDAVVNLETGKSDWTNADAQWELVQEASNFIAAARILQMFGDKIDAATQRYNMGIKLCEQVVRLSTSEVGGGTSLVVVKSQQYKTYPLNPDGDLHRSIRSSGNWPVRMRDVID